MIHFINFPLFCIYSIHYQVTSSFGIHSDSGVFFPSSKSSLYLMICVKKLKIFFLEFEISIISMCITSLRTL